MPDQKEIRDNSIEDIIAKYKPAVDALSPYMPWLKAHADREVSKAYNGANTHTTIPFAIYDANLLAFVRAAQATGRMDRNYPYVYSRNRLRSAADEQRFIERATLQNMGELFGILSRYILSGQVKGAVWAEGVRNQVLYNALDKMQELLRLYLGSRESWDAPKEQSHE